VRQIILDIVSGIVLLKLWSVFLVGCGAVLLELALSGRVFLIFPLSRADLPVGPIFPMGRVSVDLVAGTSVEVSEIAVG